MTNSWNNNPSYIEAQIEASFRDKELKKTLKNYAYKLTQSEQAAEDLVQQCRIKVRIKKYELGIPTSKALLIRIIRNEFFNEYRKKQKNPTTNITEDRQREKIVQERSENHAEYMFSITTIENEIEKLDKNLKESLKLHMQKHTYEEIAKVLNAPLGTIKSRIHHARKQLGLALVQKNESYAPFITWKSLAEPSQPWQDSLWQSL